MNDTNNLQDIISKNNYTLKNYYVSSNQIYYKFVQENDESNYIEIYSWVSGIMSGNVYRSSNKEIYEDSFYINGSISLIMI